MGVRMVERGSAGCVCACVIFDLLVMLKCLVVLFGCLVGTWVVMAVPW